MSEWYTRRTYGKVRIPMSRRSTEVSDHEFSERVRNSRSLREVIKGLGLIPAGGNYATIQARIARLHIGTKHFLGKGWNKGLAFVPVKAKPLGELLRKNSNAQSYKLKRRLLREGLKKEACEECGWCAKSVDGRVPVELDHINGDRKDNRLSNLRILCPNCHSLQQTHRGRNIRTRKS